MNQVAEGSVQPIASCQISIDARKVGVYVPSVASRTKASFSCPATI